MFHFAACIAVSAVAITYFNTEWYLALGIGFAAYLLSGGWKWARLIWLTIGRDARFIKTIAGIELKVRSMAKNKKILADLFSDAVKKHPKKAAFIQAETGEKITFEEAEELINRIANTFLKAGFQKGDVVALLMENCIEYLPIWLALTKIGVVVSLLNFNLRGDSLKHCIENSEPKAVIYSPTLEGVLKEIAIDLKYYIFSEEEGTLKNAQSLKQLMKSASSSQPPRPVELSITEKYIHIYTSGTTGLPKAAVIRGTRYLMMAFGNGSVCGTTYDDVLYNALPMYHSNGGCTLSGQCIFFGATVVIRKKFSASKFFEDCHKYNVTSFTYIGEICRYLLAQPKGEFDKKHNIKCISGNGLKQSIWRELQDRFNIPKVMEFYGATEGNANMINSVGKVGAVGFRSILVPWLFPMKLVKVDKETGVILRGSDGLAISCKPGELGEMVGQVKNDVMHKFDGYVNQAATKKKIAYDIFKKGDSAFMSGDFLTQDEEGFYYFQDRTGDTFRWKGENVSTNEVEGVVSKVLKLNDVCVYGVEVPGVEGKAGMAVISDPQNKIDVGGLYSLISACLPSYAVPMFIRVTKKELEKTATFKFRKINLRKESFDPSKCPGDQLFYYSNKEKEFVEIDAEVFHQIQQKKIRI